MCAYCDTNITTSSKFYNITNMGDLEYIGRRMNHLGPKKNNFCDRVCKRHYDLNLKRDKAHRQYNAKRERLPGIDSIFGPPKKLRAETQVPAQTHSQSISEFNAPSQVQSHRIGSWYPTITSSMPGPIQELRPPMINSGPSSTTSSPSGTSELQYRGFPHLSQQQRGLPWMWDRPQIEGNTNPVSTISDPSSATKNLPVPEIGYSTVDTLQDSSSSVVDLISYHMTKLLSLYSENTLEHKTIFDNIKDSTEQKRIGVSSATMHYAHKRTMQLQNSKRKIQKKKFLTIKFCLRFET
jgi:hypothetical protein